MKKKKSHPWCIHIRLGNALKQRLVLICVLRGEETLAKYARRAVELQIEHDLKDFPSHRLRMRPNAIIYSCEGSGKKATFAPISRTQGGEQCWLLDTVGYLPTTLGGGYAYFVDITVVGTNPGADFRGVVVEASEIIGETQRHR